MKNLKGLFLTAIIAFTVFSFANMFIQSATAMSVQTSANLVTEIVQVKNVMSTDIPAYSAVVLDTTSVEAGIMGIKTTTTVDDLRCVGYTKEIIPAGKYGVVIHKGFAKGLTNGAITAGVEVGSTATAGKVDAGTGAGVCVSGAAGTTNEVVLFLLK